MENIENDLLLLLSAILEKNIANLHLLEQDYYLNIFLQKIFNNEYIHHELSIDWEQFKSILQQKLLENGYKMTLEFEIEQIRQQKIDFVIAALFQALSVYKIFNESDFEQKINLLNYQSKSCIEEVTKEMIKEIKSYQIQEKHCNNELIEQLYRKLEQQEQTIFKFKNLNQEAQKEISNLKKSLQSQNSSNAKLQKDLKRLSLLHSDSLKSCDDQQFKSVDSFDEYKELKTQNAELKSQLQKKNLTSEENNKLKAQLQTLQKDFEDLVDQNDFYKQQQNEYEKIFSENKVNKNLLLKFQEDLNEKSNKYIRAKEKIQWLKGSIKKLEIKLQVKSKQIEMHKDNEKVLKEFSLTRINSIDDELFINELQEENYYLRNKLNDSRTDKMLDFENTPKSKQKIQSIQLKKDTSIEKAISKKNTPFKKKSLQIFMEENNCVFQNKKTSTLIQKQKPLYQCDCQENMQIIYVVLKHDEQIKITTKQNRQKQKHNQKILLSKFASKRKLKIIQLNHLKRKFLEFND